jgi:hypothetical protein
MQHNMNINTGAKRFAETLSASAPDYFFNREILSLGALPVKEGRGNPNFVGDFDIGEPGILHKYLL